MKLPLLYTELAAWWPVMSAPADYAEEAALYHAAFERYATAPPRTMLELGSGGGNNASHLARHYAMTLVDLSPDMVAVSEALNPGCAHHVGDMRAVRLGRSFDAVFIHDAIAYMTTEADLRAALATAYDHCKPGGVALFVPDETRETWRPGTSHGGHDVGERSFRYLEWCFDPDPADTQVTTVYSLLWRAGDEPVRHATESHISGLFPRDTWLGLIADVGFEPHAAPYAHSELDPAIGHELFVGLRPVED